MGMVKARSLSCPFLVSRLFFFRPITGGPICGDCLHRCEEDEPVAQPAVICEVSAGTKYTLDFSAAQEVKA